MFLLPIGLQSRVIKWPWACLIIMGITCASSIFYFPENTAYVKSSQEMSVKKSKAKTASARKSFRKKAQKNDWLVRGNIHLRSVVKAIGTHDGWVHLIGNMLLFAIFAFYLEQRVGAVGVLLLYLIGAVGANLIQTPFLPQGTRLLGASGAVSAAIGAFAVYFGREKMQCWLKFGGKFNRRILIPAWLYIGFFVLVSDLVGFLGNESSIAHLAHFGGLILGAMFAAIEMDFFPLKKTFLFRQEQHLYYEAKDCNYLEEKMVFFRQIYQLNRTSFYSFRALFLYLCKQGFQYASLKEEDQAFVSEILTSCMTYEEKDGKYGLTQEILTLIPLTWNIGKIDLKVSPGHIVGRAAYFRKFNDYIHTLRLYDLFFDKFAAHPKAQEIRTDIMKIFDEIEKFEIKVKMQILGELLLYAEHHPENHFPTQIKQLIHQVHREEKNEAS